MELTPLNRTRDGLGHFEAAKIRVAELLGRSDLIIKVNHALVLGGEPGIGKDTLIEPVKGAVGPWNSRKPRRNRPRGVSTVF